MTAQPSPDVLEQLAHLYVLVLMVFIEGKLVKAEGESYSDRGRSWLLRLLSSTRSLSSQHPVLQHAQYERRI